MGTVLRRLTKKLINFTLKSQNLKPLAMAWRSVGSNNAEFVDQMEQHRVITSKLVKELMLETDRKHYCPRKPYVDEPQSIGFGVTISAPHMHVYALDFLLEKFKDGGKALDVGSGSGYLTACLARANRKATHATANREKIVVGIEHHAPLVEQAKKNINADDPTLITNNELIIVEGDGRNGYAAYAPYDIIHVGAAAPDVPEVLLSQLKPGGRLICPVGSEKNQFLEQFDKNERGEISRKKLFGVSYVPLTDLNGTSR